MVQLFKRKIANHFARLASLFAALVSQGRVLWAGRGISPGRVDLVDALAMPDKVEIDIGHFGDRCEYDVNGRRCANKEERKKMMPWFSFFFFFGSWMDGWMVLESTETSLLILSHEKGKEELFLPNWTPAGLDWLA